MIRETLFASQGSETCRILRSRPRGDLLHLARMARSTSTSTYVDSKLRGLHAKESDGGKKVRCFSIRSLSLVKGSEYYFESIVSFSKLFDINRTLANDDYIEEKSVWHHASCSSLVVVETWLQNSNCSVGKCLKCIKNKCPPDVRQMSARKTLQTTCPPDICLLY